MLNHFALAPAAHTVRLIGERIRCAQECVEPLLCKIIILWSHYHPQNLFRGGKVIGFNFSQVHIGKSGFRRRKGNLISCPQFSSFIAAYPGFQVCGLASHDDRDIQPSCKCHIGPTAAEHAGKA